MSSQRMLFSAGVCAALAIYALVAISGSARNLSAVGLMMVPVGPVLLFVTNRASSYSKEARLALKHRGFSVPADMSLVVPMLETHAHSLRPGLLQDYRRYQFVGVLLAGYSLTWIVVLLFTVLSSHAKA